LVFKILKSKKMSGYIRRKRCIDEISTLTSFMDRRCHLDDLMLKSIEKKLASNLRIKLVKRNGFWKAKPQDKSYLKLIYELIKCGADNWSLYLAHCKDDVELVRLFKLFERLFKSKIQN